MNCNGVFLTKPKTDSGSELPPRGTQFCDCYLGGALRHDQTSRRHPKFLARGGAQAGSATIPSIHKQIEEN